MTAGDLPSYAHERMTADAIAAHAVRLANVVDLQHQLLVSLTETVSRLDKAVEADDAAFVVFHGAAAGAVKLLDCGQAAEARAVLARLVEAQVPVRPRVDAVPVAPLPAWVTFPGDAV